MWQKRIIWFVMKWLERRLGLCEHMSLSCKEFEPHPSELLSRRVIQPDYFRKFTLVAKGMLDLRGHRRTASMLLK